MAEIESANTRLGRSLPDDWVCMLTSLGPLDLESIKFVTPARIEYAEDVWFRDFLESEERAELGHLLYLADTGSDNYYVFDTVAKGVRLLSHDPAGIFEWIPSAAELLHFAFAQLPGGYYGWPDEDVVTLVEKYTQGLLEDWWNRAGTA